MAVGVLQDLTLGYQLLWNTQRQVAGVRVNLDGLPNHSIDAGQLLAAVNSTWHAKAPALMLSTSDSALLAQLLKLDVGPMLQLVVPADSLNDSHFLHLVTQAKQRGMQLVWQGQPGQTPLPALSASFVQHIISLSPEQALLALRVSRQNQHDSRPESNELLSSPVHAHQIVDRVPSQVLVKHCLDEQAAYAVIGWPTEEVLYAHRQGRLQPDAATLRCVLQAIEENASMEQVEQQLGQDPVLVYRFFRYVNSAGLGLDRAIDSLRHGLTVLGLSRTASWLRELLASASQNADLKPIRQSLALRARFLALLLDAGESDALRRELSLCGLLSRIDWLLGESMASALRGLPLPTRVTEALLSQEGPYWPFLALANALENPYPTPVPVICAKYSFDLEEVNLTLLGSLAELRPN